MRPQASQDHMVHAYAERALQVYGSGDVRWEAEAPTENRIQSIEKTFSGEQHIIPVALGHHTDFSHGRSLFFRLSSQTVVAARDDY